MILTPVANSQNFFWRSLRRYQHIALSFDYGYATRDLNYANFLMKLTPGISISIQLRAKVFQKILIILLIILDKLR
jgi:hypothetical protein